MSIISSPTQKSPERGFTLQKYLLLHSQQDALQKHLQAIASQPTHSHPRTVSPGSRSHRSNSSSSSNTSLSSSPESPSPHFTSAGFSTAQFSAAQESRARRFSLPPILDESIVHEVEEEEEKLMHVNQQIKTTLTDLLNCESVKNDNRYRMWVQTRLMDAEKELKGSRRRGSCVLERRRKSQGFEGMYE